MAAFKNLPTNDRPEGENNSDDCCDIQFVLDPVYLVYLVCLVYSVCSSICLACLVQPD